MATLVYFVLGDTICPPEAQARADWYGLGIPPVLVFDGTDIVREEEETAYYTVFNAHLQQARSHDPRVELGLEGTATGDTILARLTVYAEDSVSIDDCHYFVVVCEDSLVGWDGLYYSKVVRRIVPDDMGGALVLNQGYLDTTFAINNRWPGARLGLVGFVQNMTTREVLQAVRVGRIQEARQ